MMNKENISCVLLILSLLSLEIFVSFFFAYDNFGWWMPGVLIIITILNVLPILLYIFKKKIIANIITLLIGLFIVPYQLFFVVKYIKLKEEAANISNYVYQNKIENFSFPENLNNYKFKFPKLKEDIIYKKENDNEFIILYSVGTKSTSHYFRHSRGYYWDYYDD